MNRSMPVVLVYGGNGALGQAVIARFKGKGWKTVSVDFVSNDAADISISVKSSSEEDAKHVVNHLKEQRIDLNAIVCVSGGIASGNLKEDVFGTLDKMWKLNVQSSIAAAYIASQLLIPAGLLVFTGAHAVFTPNASTLAYGMTKAAVHHMIAALASGTADESGMPMQTVVLGLLPFKLNTPLNRKSQPNAILDNWTPLDEVAGKLLEWAEGVDRPFSGTLMQIITIDKKTEFKPISSNYVVQ
eukprot:TRINITY_DN17959_c0_g1_i1.p1 TRINITY_DN17959_c0_g1~~TRINITY_DN17959_c0_g1_i1.p1  ORF type:complete len:255 (-),score=73.64 TRINITY_DN17959_c0_g1_i1:61-789(-)